MTTSREETLLWGNTFLQRKGFLHSRLFNPEYFVCIFTTALHTLRVTLCRVTIAPASRRQRATSSSISWSPTPPPPTSRQIQPSLPAPALRQTLPDETCRDLPWSCCVRCSSVTRSKPVRELLIGQAGANYVAGWSEWWVVSVYIKLPWFTKLVS